MSPALQVLYLAPLNIKHDLLPRFVSTYVGPGTSGILSSTLHANVVVPNKQNLRIERSWIKQPQFVVLNVCRSELPRAAKTSLLSTIL